MTKKITKKFICHINCKKQKTKKGNEDYVRI